MLSPNKTLVDENNLEIEPNSVIHCLGSLFQVTDTGLRHIVVKKIDDDTYFADSDLYIQLNKLAFVEQSDVVITPDAAPRKEGLLASVYRFMTAPLLVRTPSNVMTRNKRKKFSPNKLVRINNSATLNITSEAENALKVPTSQEIIGLNSRCEKAIMNEVKFFIHSYKEFMTCKNEKLQCVIDTLNAANTERCNKVKIQYPGFTWDPSLIDIGTLVTLVQRAYPAQVVEYTLGRGKKSDLEKKLDLDSENTVRNKVEEPAGLFPPTKTKTNNYYQENFRDLNEEQIVDEVNDDDRGSYQPLDKNSHDYRSKLRSPDLHRERNRYDTMDRRNRHDSYTSRSDNSYNTQLTSSQQLEVKLFLDKISYFDGSNNKEALNFLAQCEEAADKMKASEVTIAWSKLAG